MLSLCYCMLACVALGRQPCQALACQAPNNFGRRPLVAYVRRHVSKSIRSCLYYVATVVTRCWLRRSGRFVLRLLAG